jgi:hypothetical protein
MFPCARCGVAQRAGATFCSQCGHKHPVPASVPSPAAVAPPAPAGPAAARNPLARTMVMGGASAGPALAPPQAAQGQGLLLGNEPAPVSQTGPMHTTGNRPTPPLPQGGFQASPAGQAPPRAPTQGMFAMGHGGLQHGGLQHGGLQHGGLQHGGLQHGGLPPGQQSFVAPASASSPAYAGSPPSVQTAPVQGQPMHGVNALATAPIAEPVRATGGPARPLSQTQIGGSFGVPTSPANAGLPQPSGPQSPAPGPRNTPVVASTRGAVLQAQIPVPPPDGPPSSAHSPFSSPGHVVTSVAAGAFVNQGPITATGPVVSPGAAGPLPPTPPRCPHLRRHRQRARSWRLIRAPGPPRRRASQPRCPLPTYPCIQHRTLLCRT